MDFKQYLHKTMSYKLIESVEYSPTKESTNFLSKFGIDDEKLDYLGSGDYGTAYSVGNNKVLKITSSKSEYELAKQIMNGNFKHIVKIYAVEKINNDYFILQEELIIKSNIEDKWNEMMNMLQSQDLPVQYIDNFDEDEYEEQNGPIRQDIQDFMNGIYAIVSDYRKLVGDTSDIRLENIGYSINKELKAFDIDDRSKL